jgi:hypothetical protein
MVAETLNRVKHHMAVVIPVPNASWEKDKNVLMNHFIRQGIF